MGKAAPVTKDFWKQEQITEKQFIDVADTFDILLFSCNTAAGKIIRTYSGSEFDHAAMVLRYDCEPGEVYFIEATGDIGVAYKKWSLMNDELGKFYKKIVLRRLTWHRPNDALEILDKFLDEVHGNHY